jgi:uncharacterized surface protein with fasciclin (FAS1) repeats
VSIARWHEALEAAGLAGLNQSPGAWTLLAPSDDAFEAMLDEHAITWHELLTDVDSLRSLLLGHVLAQRHAARELPAGLWPALAADGLIEIAQSAAGPLLSDGNGLVAQVRLADRPVGTADNAVLHVIDRVLQPPRASLWEQLKSQPELSAFTEALALTDLATLLAGPARLTVLAPHNEGFRHLGARLGLRQRELLAQPALLREVLGQHVLPGRWLSSDLPWGGQLATLSGQALALAALGLVGYGDAAQALQPGSDQRARNGMLHRLAAPLLAGIGAMQATDKGTLLHPCVSLCS